MCCVCEKCEVRRACLCILLTGLVRLQLCSAHLQQTAQQNGRSIKTLKNLMETACVLLFHASLWCIKFCRQPRQLHSLAHQCGVLAGVYNHDCLIILLAHVCPKLWRCMLAIVTTMVPSCSIVTYHRPGVLARFLTIPRCPGAYTPRPGMLARFLNDSSLPMHVHPQAWYACPFLKRFLAAHAHTPPGLVCLPVS